MLHAALRWIVPIANLLLLGPIAGLLTASLRAPDGGSDTTLLLSSAPVFGLIAGVGVFALATIGGGVAARLFGPRDGLFSAGLVLAWAAWGTGSIDEILRRTQTPATLYTIAVEGAIVLALAMLSAAIILTLGRGRSPFPPGAHGHAEPASPPSPAPSGPFLPAVLTALTAGFAPRRDPDDDDDSGALSAAITGLVIAVGAGGAGAWIVAREALKGQTFAAAVVAGILAAGVGRAAAHRAPATLFVLAIGLLAILGPVAATLMHTGSTDAVRAAYASSLLPLARVLPLDWFAGAFIGIPIGIAWAGSMLEKHAPAPA